MKKILIIAGIVATSLTAALAQQPVTSPSTTNHGSQVSAEKHARNDARKKAHRQAKLQRKNKKKIENVNKDEKMVKPESNPAARKPVNGEKFTKKKTKHQGTPEQK